MKRNIGVIICVLIFFFSKKASQLSNEDYFQPEGAKIVVENKKFIRNASFFTYRKNRNSPYFCVLYGESTKQWGNNVTIMFEYYNIQVRSESYRVEAKLCELIKFNWVKDFIVYNSDFGNRPVCPIEPGFYNFTGFQLPPRNFPIPIKKADYHIKLSYYIGTASTKETILELIVTIRYKKGTNKRNII